MGKRKKRSQSDPNEDPYAEDKVIVRCATRRISALEYDGTIELDFGKSTIQYGFEAKLGLNILRVCDELGRLRFKLFFNRAEPDIEALWHDKYFVRCGLGFIFLTLEYYNRANDLGELTNRLLYIQLKKFRPPLNSLDQPNIELSLMRSEVFKCFWDNTIRSFQEQK